MTDEIKRLSVAEFRALGYLHEVNRLVLHPCGLALEVIRDPDGSETFGGVWDYRDDPEGITYDPPGVDPELIASVASERERHADARRALLGAVVQLPRVRPERVDR